MEIGDKFLCIKSVENLLGWNLFEEGKIYEIIGILDNEYFLNHNLYSNEYSSFSKEFILENFIKE